MMPTRSFFISGRSAARRERGNRLGAKVGSGVAADLQREANAIRGRPASPMLKGERGVGSRRFNEKAPPKRAGLRWRKIKGQ